MTEPQPPRAPLDLRRQRDVGALIADGLGLYFREFRTFFLIALAVVVPVELIVSGIGLGQLTADYDESPSVEQGVIPAVTRLFVIAPLMIGMCVYALLDVADERKPRAGAAIQRGLDVFAPLLLVVALSAIGVALGLLALIVPGIYLLVRWAFAVQSTVIENRRGADALRRSGELVQGSWWRVLGVILLTNLLVLIASSLVGAPLLAAADATGRAVYQLAGTILGGVLLGPPAALITTLLYFDQRQRKGV